MAESIINDFIKMGEEWAIQQVENLAKSLIFGTEAVTQSVVQGSAMAAALNPAAIAASVASFGAADVTGGAAFSAALATGMAETQAMTKLADGGVMLGTTLLSMGSPVIGGEAGHEAVLPLQNSKYPGLMEMAK